MATIVEDFEDEEAMTDDLAKQFFETEVNNNLIVEFGAPLGDLSSSKNVDWLHEVSNAKSAIVSIPGGGYGTAIGDFVEAHGIADSVTFGAAVSKIRYDDDIVQIDFDKDGESQSVLAQTVLVTASVGVLQSGYIDFEPELPKEKLEAIGSMDMGVLDKLVMYWDEETMAQSPDFKAKWDENMNNIWLELVTPKSETSDDWTVFFNSRKYNGLHSLSAWIGGSAALEMEAKTDKVVLDEVLTNLRKMFGPDVKPPTKFKLTHWGTDPSFMGAYTYKSVDVDTLETAKVIGQNVDGKVFFAGEHTSTDGWAATCVGAYETGKMAGSAMTKSISDEIMVSVNYS